MVWNGYRLVYYMPEMSQRSNDVNNPTNPIEYIPYIYIYCLGFVQKIQAYRHAKNVYIKKRVWQHSKQ